MSDIEEIHAAVEQFNAALDSGSIEALAATGHADVIICNEHQPTTVGVQALIDKYAPRMEAFSFKSWSEITEIKFFGDFAVVVANFNVQSTNKETGEAGGGKGRVVLGYIRDENGDWKMALDVDNNG